MTQNILQRFVLLVIVIMPILTPVFAQYGWFSVQAENIKTVWGVIGSLTSIFLFLLIKSKQGKLNLIKSNFLTPIWIFIGWCFVTLLWVEDGYLATIMLAQFFSYALIFTLIVNLFFGTNFVKRLPEALLISMFFISIIGLLQYYFPNNWYIQNVFMQTGIPGSTFVNKNMASHFMVMVLPFSLILLLAATHKKKVLLYSCALLIGAWFLINTTARQAYIAVFLEVLLFLLFIALDTYKNREEAFLKIIKLKFFKLIALLLVMLSLLFVSNLTSEGWNIDKGSKLDNLQNINLNGGNSRIPAWRNTIEMIIENPILGVGIGQWPQKYPLYYDRAMNDELFGEKSRLKRLHNDYLEMLANVGVIGFFILLWLVYIVIKTILATLKDVNNKDRIYILGFTMGLLGFSIVAMFSFPVRVYLPAFLVFVYLAVIFLYSSNDYKFHLFNFNYNKKYTKFFIVITLALTSYIAIFSIKWLMSEYHYNNAYTLHKGKIDDAAFLASMKALDYNSWSPKNYGKTAEVLMALGYKEEAIPYLKKLIDITPFNTNALIMLSTIYEVSDKQMERKILEFILSFDSKNVQALSFLVKNLSSSQRGRDAAIVYQRLKNSYEYFKNRNNFGPYHQLVGHVSVSIGDYKYARYAYNNAIKEFPTAENYYNLAILEYDHLKNYNKGIIYAKKALEINPNMPKNKEIKNLIDKYESSIKQ